MTESDNPYAAPSGESDEVGFEFDDGVARSLADLDSAAKGLLIASCVWPVLQVFSLVSFQTNTSLPDADAAHLLRMQVYGATIITVYQLFIIYGAICMRRRSSYIWARIAAWLAMIPGMGLCLILSVPFGWLCNRSLKKPGVRNAFRSS